MEVANPVVSDETINTGSYDESSFQLHHANHWQRPLLCPTSMKHPGVLKKLITQCQLTFHSTESESRWQFSFESKADPNKKAAKDKKCQSQVCVLSRVGF